MCLTGIEPETDLYKIKKDETKIYIGSNIYLDENGGCFYNEKKLNVQFLYNDNKIEMDYYLFMELLHEIYNNEYILPFEFLIQKEEEEEENKNKKRKIIEENDFIDNEIDKLRAEIEYYKNLFNCVICLDEKKDIVNNNCKHLSMCKKCSVKIMSQKKPMCPICRKNIDKLIQIFF